MRTSDLVEVIDSVLVKLKLGELERMFTPYHRSGVVTIRVGEQSFMDKPRFRLWAYQVVVSSQNLRQDEREVVKFFDLDVLTDDRIFNHLVPLVDGSDSWHMLRANDGEQLLQSLLFGIMKLKATYDSLIQFVVDVRADEIGGRTILELVVDDDDGKGVSVSTLRDVLEIMTRIRDLSVELSLVEDKDTPENGRVVVAETGSLITLTTTYPFIVAAAIVYILKNILILNPYMVQHRTKGLHQLVDEMVGIRKNLKNGNITQEDADLFIEVIVNSTMQLSNIGVRLTDTVKPKGQSVSAPKETKMLGSGYVDDEDEDSDEVNLS